jgi:hypothetical protein
MWWSLSTTCTAPAATEGGSWSNATTAMFVASGIGASAATRAMPSMPGDGSSRYSTSPSRAFATRMPVSGVHAAFGSRRSGTPGNAGGLDLVVGREHATLQLDRREAPAVDHPAGLIDELVGGERLAPFVGIGAGVSGPLVEQVRAVRHGVAHAAAEQVDDRPPDRPSLHVEARHLERREDPVHRAGTGDHAGDPVAPVRAGPEYARDHLPQAFGLERVVTRQLGRHGAQPLQVDVVGVGLAPADQALDGVDPHDRPQRERLVHADRVEQRRVGERDRGDGDPADPGGGRAHAEILSTGGEQPGGKGRSGGVPIVEGV